MKKRVISLILALVMALGMIPTAIFPASAASTPEEALGEINIYNSGVTLDYLVNADEGEQSPQAIAHFRDQVFQTRSGTRLLNSIYMRSQEK